MPAEGELRWASQREAPGGRGHGVVLERRKPPGWEMAHGLGTGAAHAGLAEGCVREML